MSVATGTVLDLMGRVRTLRFHIEYGPEQLFITARERLNDMAGLSLEIPHAKARFGEREIPVEYLTDFQPGYWEVIAVETAVRTGRIVYMSLRRELESAKYLWIVIAYEHVITAWIDGSPRTRATNPLIVKNGPAWDAASAGQAQAKTQAQAEWEGVWLRRARAQEVLTALANSPVRPNGERLEQAAQLVLAGATWTEAANAAGWVTSRSLKAAIKRILRAAQTQR